MSKHKTDHIVTVGFVALGCPKNVVDSEKMLAYIGSAGFVISGDINNSDIVVINTCGFIEPAKLEAIDAIKDVIKRKRKGKVKKVIVAGCLSQRMGKELSTYIQGIDAIIGLPQRDNIAEIIKQTISKKPHEKCSFYLDGNNNTVSNDTERLLITPSHWAYLRISEGCNRKCSFCTIPAIRGSFRSKPPEAVIAEAKELVNNGAVELNIIAQDSNFYGKDLGIEQDLSMLIKELNKIDKLKWIRIMYLYPAGVDDNLIETIASTQKVVNYIDMPVQHINNEILKKMHRSDRKEKTISLIEKLRRTMPDVVLRTTIITGFPGETDQQFEELLDFIKWARFDALGCFTFFAEVDTPAAQLPDQLPDEIKQHRADQLMLVQQKIAFEKNTSRIGTEITCLVDEVTPDSALGRFFGQAPHIDSICHIRNSTAQPGDFITAKVAGTDNYDLIVSQI